MGRKQGISRLQYMNEDDQEGSQYPQIIHIYNASGLITAS
jgi:hypothetical protein